MEEKIKFSDLSFGLKIIVGWGIISLLIGIVWFIIGFIGGFGGLT